MKLTDHITSVDEETDYPAAAAPAVHAVQTASPAQAKTPLSTAAALTSSSCRARNRKISTTSFADEEKLEGDGHIGPSGDPLPRPKEHGGCDCPVCALNYERLAARANPQPQPTEPE